VEIITILPYVLLGSLSEVRYVKTFAETPAREEHQCAVQPSSERLPPVADGNSYKNPQPEHTHTHTHTHLRTLSQKWHVSLSSGFRETHRRGGIKSIKYRGDGRLQGNKVFRVPRISTHKNARRWRV
jgi:hypothetical protein